jgi:hypothetical protein
MSDNPTTKLEDMIRDGLIPGLRINAYNPAMAYDAMDTHTPAGSMVRFTGHGGYDSEQTRARLYLDVGSFYTVARIDIGSCSSMVEFTEVPGQRFNTVMFEQPLPQHQG